MSLLRRRTRASGGTVVTMDAVRRTRMRRRLVVLLAGALCLLESPLGSVLPFDASSAGAATITPAKKATKPATFLGSYGEEARWVVAENARKGTTSWQISGTPKAGSIQGFSNVTYASAGQTVSLYVSTGAKRFSVQAYRMGYYGGAGARLVWTSKSISGATQPACPVRAGIYMVTCDNWHVSLKVKISKAFVQGDYLFKLVGSGHEQSYVPLTVWDPSSHAAYLVKNDVFTWQAWNPYGGDDFYQGTAACAPTYPPCNRARVVSYDRPYGYGEGAGDFLVNELPLVRLAEQHGLDVTYATDVTVEQHPTLLLAHRVMLSLGHDECWSLVERDAAVAAEKAGVNLVFFAASAVLRHVRLQSSPLGPDRELVDYRDSSEDPLEGKGNPLEVTGNTWSEPPASWPETEFVGATYAGYLRPGAKPLPFVVADASTWLFRGTGLHTGSVIPAVIASDFDQLEVGSPHQADEQIFGHSPIVSADVQTNVGGRPYADMTYYTDPKSRAGVFDSGTNNWIPAMACKVAPRSTCRSRTIDRITGNLLYVLGQGPAGKIEPSVPNWRAIYQ